MKKTLLTFIVMIILLGILILIVSNKKSALKQNGGVVITFDDYSIKEWCWADSILQKYHWKACFNISNFDKIKKTDFEKLRMLQSGGHEIAGHGLNHIDAVETVKTEGMNAYLKKEIFPMIKIMKKELGGVSTFVYPFGSRTGEIDDELLKYFKILRGTTYGISDITNKACYFNNTRSVAAIGIDKSYENMTIANLKKRLDYAKKNNKIIILYGHVPVEKSEQAYRTEIKTLKFICNYVNNNNMPFYTYKDLDSLIIKFENTHKDKQ